MTKEEAIRRIKSWNLDSDDMEVLSVIIPELKESDDERIEKAIVDALLSHCNSINLLSARGYQIEDVKNWLEKQKAKERLNRMAPIYNNKESFESALEKAWKYYNESASRTVDSFEDDYIECVFSKGFREGFLYKEKQKEQKPILEVFGFKVGDAVRLKDGDGRKHIIKSFEEVKGIHGPNFYLVEFEDDSARDGIYPGEEYPNGYYTQMEKFEEEQKPVEPSDDELQRHQEELYNFKVFATKQAREHHISFVHDFEWNNFCAELLSYFAEQKSAESISRLTIHGKGVYKICPHCKSRMIRNDSIVYTFIPPQYEYNCPKCGTLEFDTVMYDNSEMEEQKPISKTEPIVDGLTEFEKQVSYLIASAMDKEHEYSEGYIKWAAQSLMGHVIKNQKPVWSEEDKKRLADISWAIRHCIAYDNKKKKQVYDWFENRFESLRYQPKQEWSEEDGMITEHELKVLKLVAEKDGTCLMGLYNKLKSFCPRQIYQASKHDLAIRFMNYLDDNRPIGKMCLSNKECEDIYNAFEENDWVKILRYAEKYGK